MKRFVWRLQRVLDVKEREEQIKRAELFKLTEELAKTRAELLLKQRKLENMIAELNSKKPKTRIGEQEFFLRHSTVNNEMIKRLKLKTSEFELKQKEKIAEVLKVRRFKKGLEKLREQTKREYIANQEKLQQKEADESAGVRFVRKHLQAALRTVRRTQSV
ncbi:MAG: hypothetical protein ACYTBP_02480 [Planctomycetota bacterium]|jgi:flagellar FliJ protein